MSAILEVNSITEEPEFGGPHPWQTQTWARLVRRSMRQKEYFRWVDEYCTSVSIKGTEHLADLDGPAIFVANHQSHMDTPVIMKAMPEPIRDNLYFGAAADRWFVRGKKKLILQPWYQSLVMGTFPIVRGGGSKTLDYAQSLLAKGCNLCIFPEGTRAQSNSLGRFRHGVSLIALRNQVPVVPVVLKGLRELRPKGAKEVTPGPVGVSILRPVQPTAESTVESLTNQLWENMNREFFESIPFPAQTAPSQAHKAA